MSTKLFPVYSFIVDQGNVALGQFIGLNLGPNLVATQQGLFLGLDAAPSSGGGGAVIFDGGVPVKNARTDRGATQSPIDNTKQGIVNLGSRSIGATVGATKNYATIGGGDQNTASGLNSVVAGGTLNVASGDNSVVSGGTGNVASGARSVICGSESNLASGIGALILGEECEASGDHSFVFGHFAYAYDDFNIAIGEHAEAWFASDLAIGTLCVADGNFSLAIGYQAFADSTGALALGRTASALHLQSIAIGNSATANGRDGIIIGNGADGDGSRYQIAIGALASSSGTSAIAIGQGTYAADIGALALGDAANASAQDALCIGNNSVSLGIGGVRLGSNGFNGQRATRGIAIGDSTTVVTGADDSVAMGSSCYNAATATRAVSIGPTIENEAPSSVVLGDTCRASATAERSLSSGYGAIAERYGEAYRSTWSPALTYYGGVHEIESNGTGTAAPVNLLLGDGSELNLFTPGSGEYAIRITIEILAAQAVGTLAGQQKHQVTAHITGGALVIQDQQQTFVDAAGATFTTTISVPATTQLRINCDPGANTQKYLAHVTWSLIPM